MERRTDHRPRGLPGAPTLRLHPQDPHLFSGSLRDNVLLGLDDGDGDGYGDGDGHGDGDGDGDGRTFEDAAHTAVLAPDLAAMQDGADTVVGPRGLRLSGGQLQRTAIARMLARRPELLVLDDVSSALDPATEQLLWSRLLDGSVTVLAVSHRPALLRAAARVVVLKDGRVDAAGTAQEVLAESAELRRIQADPG
ncbi:ATP-binding cassette domain-containing protein [Streptomyces stramineus]